ncbi:hypothetical protein TYRP_001548 [Tyrophagus putrescentiae]|nr:hypothetical protein TYRP_001548 [Tyrophagus putrescentiae]
MNSDELVKGKWANEPCTKKNLLFASESKKWTLERRCRKLLRDSMSKTKNCRKQNLNNCSLKISFQLASSTFSCPKEESPQELATGVQMGGHQLHLRQHFFPRGGEQSRSFGAVQEDFSPFMPGRVLTRTATIQHPLVGQLPYGMLGDQLDRGRDLATISFTVVGARHDKHLCGGRWLGTFP